MTAANGLNIGRARLGPMSFEAREAVSDCAAMAKIRWGISAPAEN